MVLLLTLAFWLAAFVVGGAIAVGLLVLVWWAICDIAVAIFVVGFVLTRLGIAGISRLRCRAGA